MSHEISENNIFERQRKQLAEIAKKGAKIKNLGRMCNSCAFKYNSAANLEAHNVESAWEVVAFGGVFNCHIESGIDKGCKCIGFLHAKQFFDSVE